MCSSDLDENCLSCDPAIAAGDDEDRHWVIQNVPTLPVTHRSLSEMRRDFWNEWRKRSSSTLLIADCAWPVESNFIAACVADFPSERKSQGPYPLLDIPSVLFGLNRPINDCHERLPSELPAHHPLHDARQSARIFSEEVAIARGWKPRG